MTEHQNRENMEPIRNGRKVAFFPLPFQGHINPIIQLANILYFKGFSIAIMHTKFNSLDPSKHPNFSFHCIQEELIEAIDPGVLLLQFNVICEDPFRDCLAKLLSEEDTIICLITDAAFHFTQAVADSFKLPRMALRTSGALSFLLYANFPSLRERGYLPIQESRMEEPVVEFPPLKNKDLPYTTNQDAFDQLLLNMIKETRKCSGLIVNTFEDLEESALATLCREFDIPIYPIGPFHKHYAPLTSISISLLTPDQNAISWLDKQEPKSVIYVSFGSGAEVNESEFLEIAWGLYNSKQPFLWVVRPGSVLGKEWLESLPKDLLENLNERGHIVKWAPQLEVLNHPAVGAFWTHNGWNSTLESISEGVPMICTPRGADQKVNARLVSDGWRVGLQLADGLEGGNIVEVVKKLMVEKEGEEIRDRALRWQEKADNSLRLGGSSSQSLDGLVGHILSSKY